MLLKVNLSLFTFQGFFQLFRDTYLKECILMAEFFQFVSPVS